MNQDSRKMDFEKWLIRHDPQTRVPDP